MIKNLNLASDPFRNRTTPYLLSLMLLTVAFGGGIFAFMQWRNADSERTRGKETIAQMEADIKRLKGEGEKVQQNLSPDQKNLLVAAHKLVDNKVFGWSRLFADLESVMPNSVSASKISIDNIYREGDKVKAELQFGVLSRDYGSVMSMISAMNNSGLFQAELRGQDL